MKNQVWSSSSSGVDMIWTWAVSRYVTPSLSHPKGIKEGDYLCDSDVTHKLRILIFDLRDLKREDDWTTYSAQEVENILFCFDCVVDNFLGIAMYVSYARGSSQLIKLWMFFVN